LGRFVAGLGLASFRCGVPSLSKPLFAEAFEAGPGSVVRAAEIDLRAMELVEIVADAKVGLSELAGVVGVAYGLAGDEGELDGLEALKPRGEHGQFADELVLDRVAGFEALAEVVQFVLIGWGVARVELVEVGVVAVFERVLGGALFALFGFGTGGFSRVETVLFGPLEIRGFIIRHRISFPSAIGG
jgi:hypothetical protein